MRRWELHHADCRDAMRAMVAESVDAVVTDPPYGLAFMGREWDHGVPGVELWREALRVAKPGAHLVAFGGTRTFHRLACAIEDAGWEIRDCLSWLYGSGFPKSLDVSKALDKAAGAKREVLFDGGSDGVVRAPRQMQPGGGDRRETYRQQITAPATDAARAWQGWGTALKPAWEPVILARKPLVGTVAANVLAHGTGAMNIDATRIGMSESDRDAARVPQRATHGYAALGDGEGRNGERFEPSAGGRWPANVALDEEAATMLDAQTGVLHGHGSTHKVGSQGWFSGAGPTRSVNGGDSGGASRFFYTAKASRRERGEGNTHPTVKPTALMRWLVRLVCPPGGLVLDPFNGSGSTGVAALAEGMRYVGCEREAEYVEITRRRLASPWEDDEPDESDTSDKPEPRAAMQLELWR